MRRHDDRMLGGVCAGIADYLRVDVTLVRVLAVVGACLGMGSLVVAYLVAWVLLPGGVSGQHERLAREVEPPQRVEVV